MRGRRKRICLKERKHETMRTERRIVRVLEKDDRKDGENYIGQKWKKEAVEDDEGQNRKKESKKG